MIGSLNLSNIIILEKNSHLEKHSLRNKFEIIENLIFELKI